MIVHALAAALPTGLNTVGGYTTGVAQMREVIDLLPDHRLSVMGLRGWA
jgi:hypothetical protein